MVTTRSTTPRMLFSSFLSVSVPFRPWRGSQVASCNRINTHEEMKLQIAKGVALGSQADGDKEENRTLYSKTASLESEGRPSREQRSIYRCIDPLKEQIKYIIWNLNDLAHHNGSNMIRTCHLLYHPSSFSHWDISKMKWHQQQRTHKHTTEAEGHTAEGEYPFLLKPEAIIKFPFLWYF